MKDELLAEKRRIIDRISPNEAYRELAEGAATLVDIRYFEQRLRDGTIPDAVLVNTNEIEWRCDPGSPDEYRHPKILPGDFDQRILVICNQGYQSSLKVNALKELGLQNVGDVDGGFTAWDEAGLAITPPTLLHRLGAKLIGFVDSRTR